LVYPSSAVHKYTLGKRSDTGLHWSMSPRAGGW